MSNEDVRVEVVGHATLRVQYRGRGLLTDPWLVDPIGCNSGFHFPPLVHEGADLAARTDAIYISHIHPDHFNPPTLAFFSKNTPIYIGDYRRKGFRDAVGQLGFPVIEVPFQEIVPVAGTDLQIAIVEHDYEESAAYDSAVVIRTPEFTVFENNDCFLRPEKYAWVREHFDIDYAFLGYSPASFFPISFEMDAAEKTRLLNEAAERRYRDFLDAAQILAPRQAIPFASGARFLYEPALWKNVVFNSAIEALRRLKALGGDGVVVGPGDCLLANDTVRRVSTVWDKEEEVAAIAAYARGIQGWVAGLHQHDSGVRSDLVERFRDYILGLWRATKGQLPGVRRHVIAYVVTGSEERHFFFDFSQPDERIFQWGDPAHYDMRYTYPASGLQLRLDGAIDWDELHFTDAVSVHQITYAREFYMMLRSETLDLGERPAEP